MISFSLALVALLVGYLTYGKLVERAFGPEPERPTPAFTKTDGVDYQPMSQWRVFLIQFLNIAGPNCGLSWAASSSGHSTTTCRA